MTIKDIARETGYAVSTVSRALNDHPDVSKKTKERIQAVVRAHNFVPNANARQLKQTDTRNIAVLVKGTSNMLFTPMIEQLQQLIRRRGYTDSIHYLDEDANEVTRALQLVREVKPLGFLFLGANLEYFRKEFDKIALPAVLVTNPGGELGFENLSSVCTDDAAAAEEAVNRLFQAGHRHIGVIGGQVAVSSSSAQRYEGCLRAFRAQGLEFDPDRYYKAARYSFRSAHRHTLSLLDAAPEITGLFAMSDVMAVGAIRAIRDRGLRVPEDISVVGFDGIELAAYYSPKIATIHQSQDELCRGSVALLLDRIDEEQPAAHLITPYEFVDGESLGAPRARSSG